ncbi:hypothetical protein OG783_20170 [Streptomyces jietaisiensis]|uniref:hypothetical protein n=1 Tax=Streptomyces griseoaurantiacus TaxID=68213 RepID=UPI0032498BE8
MRAAASRTPGVPPMPDRTPKTLRAVIAQNAPQLLPDFGAHWKKYVADAYDVTTVPAFMARWWGEYAIARDPSLDAYVTDLEGRAAYDCADAAEARALPEEASDIRHMAARTEPGR